MNAGLRRVLGADTDEALFIRKGDTAVGVLDGFLGDVEKIKNDKIERVCSIILPWRMM